MIRKTSLTWLAILAAAPIFAADKTIPLVVDSAGAARRNVPICARIVVPLAYADVEAVTAEVVGPGGKRSPAQLTMPSLIDGAKLTDDVPDGAAVRDVCFLLPESASGQKLALSVELSRRPAGAERKGATEAFAWKDRPGESMELDLGQRPVLRYMYRPLDESSKDAREQTYKVFHHLFDPEDRSRIVTKGPGGQYTHHRGLFYGFNRVTYGDGKQADVWHAKGDAFQSHEKLVASEAGPVLARQRLAIDWHGERGEVFAREERELTAYNTPGGTLVDFASRLTPVIEPVRLDGDPQHAGFHFRADNEVAEQTKSQTYYLRPDGQGNPGETRNWPDQSDHVNLPWNAMSFVLGDQRYTACMLDRPQNPKEARFSERDYGRFGSYFEYDLTKDRPLEVRYRVWLQRGEMTGDEVAALARDFVDPPSVTTP